MEGKRMKIAQYKTERGAAKYAAEIKRKFPSIKTQVVSSPRDGFKYGVLILTGNGQTAYAGVRPRHYENIQQAGGMTIPNSRGL